MPNAQTDSWSGYRKKRYEELKKKGYAKSEAAAVSANIEKQHRAKRGLSMKPKLTLKRRKAMFA